MCSACSSPQSPRVRSASLRLCPRAVSDYSTRGGTSANTSRSTIPWDWSSRSCCVKTFSLTPAIDRRSSPWRLGPSWSCHRISGFHFPPTTETAASKAHEYLLPAKAAAMAQYCHPGGYRTSKWVLVGEAAATHSDGMKISVLGLGHGHRDRHSPDRRGPPSKGLEPHTVAGNPIYRPRDSLDRPGRSLCQCGPCRRLDPGQQCSARHSRLGTRRGPRIAGGQPQLGHPRQCSSVESVGSRARGSLLGRCDGDAVDDRGAEWIEHARCGK